MYPYTKELTLDEALQLPLDTTVYSGYNNVHDLNGFYITTHYEQGYKLYCDALTYATHILKQAAPPEGWGYAAYDLDSGRYEGLPYNVLKVNSNEEWLMGSWKVFEDFLQDMKWYKVCFTLTDLARVEGTDTDKTEINAAQEFKDLAISKMETSEVAPTKTFPNEIEYNQAVWLRDNFPKIEVNWMDAANITTIDGLDLNSMQDSSLYGYLLRIYVTNAVFEQINKAMNEPPIPPSGIKPPVIDWEAKYKELERATTSTLNTSHGQRSFGDYVNGYCKQLDLADRVADLEAKNKEKPSGHPNYQKELLERIAELEEKLKTAKHYAENLSDKLNEAEETLKKYGTRSEVYIRAMEHKLTLLDQLKQADIEIAKASFDYYPKF